MKKVKYVKDIGQEQVEINDFFIVTKKGVFSSKNNSRYMSVGLRDKTGIIEGKIWDRVDELNGLFEKNDLVYVRSRARLYQQKPQLTITDIRKAADELPMEDIREFYPEPEGGSRLFLETYREITEGVTNPHVKALFAVLEQQKAMFEKFFLFPASIGIHHVYIGGLVEHSLSMARMGIHAASVVGGDRDIIVAGTLLHDIGKIEELELKGGFRYSDRGRLLGHIALGVMMLEKLIGEIDTFPKEIADVLSHIIISHHGVEEWGSPKKPMCVEALIVHYLDNLDAKVMGVKEHLKENMENDRWSEYHRLYESFFYKLPER
jgi:3'-5' exoribonuclease